MHACHLFHFDHSEWFTPRVLHPLFLWSFLVQGQQNLLVKCKVCKSQMDSDDPVRRTPKKEWLKYTRSAQRVKHPRALTLHTRKDSIDNVLSLSLRIRYPRVFTLVSLWCHAMIMQLFDCFFFWRLSASLVETTSPLLIRSLSPQLIELKVYRNPTDST